MTSGVTTPQKVWTESELKALPDDGCRHELVGGELTLSPKNDFYHGRICTRLSSALHAYAVEHRHGAVLDSSTGFWMHNRNCRAPDISFVTRSRMAQLGFKPSARQFFPGAPDLAVEILSPGNTRGDLEQRLKDFFSSGARIVWLVDPDSRSVEICIALENRQTLGPGGSLEGGDLLPGFSYPVSNLFKEWEWD